MKNPLRNKEGFSYILTCVLVLITVLLIFAAMQYAFIYHTAREQKNETQLKLDSYVTKYAVEKYNALKQGGVYEKYIDSDGLAEGAYLQLGFAPNDRQLSEEKYVMSRPTISTLSGDAFGVTVEYEIKIPFVLFDREIAEITVPVTIISQFKQK